MTANAHMTVTCERCSTPFHVKPSRLRNGSKTRFCSRACRRASTPDRFWNQVDIRGPDDCWPWKGGLRVRDYGGLMFEGKHRLAHHVAFKLKHGYWSPYLRHSCDNPPCCNHAHLLEGTHADNMRDKVQRGRQPRGESLPHRLTVAEVLAIRRDERGHGQVAKAYGLDLAHCWRIRTRKIWKHVQ
jgi:hypothetical protein